MREILFKAQTFGNIWVYGNYTRVKFLEEYIHAVDARQVDPNTVCQFTGMVDSDGKKVFEGDYDIAGDVVMWCDRKKGWSFNIYDHPTKTHISCHCYLCEGNFEIAEVINFTKITGNIHEK